MKQVLSVIAFLLFFWIVMVASCKRDKDNLVIINLTPIAKAGLDQAITFPDDSVVLDGTASGDTDGKITEWLWSIISGPTSFTIVNAAVSRTVVKNLTVGVYKFELKVTDDEGAVGRDTIQVSVIQLNRAPIAKAGADISITLPLCNSMGVAELDGSASSDPDNNINNYLWTKISGPITFNIINRTTLKVRVESLVVGIYAFELQAIDQQGLSSKDTVLVNVRAATPGEYNLDLSFNGVFRFVDNYKGDCYYYYYYYPGACNYYDLTTIEATGMSGTIGQLSFSLYETADTAVSSDLFENFMRLGSADGRNAYGSSSINFKKLIQKGGGSFTGTMTVKGGSAEGCKQDIFKNLAPLNLSGTIDTAAHTVSVNIKGKIYF